MGAKFFVCEHCGNLVGMIHDAGVPMMCCGQKMTALVPNTVEASGEKHKPVVKVEGNTVTFEIEDLTQENELAVYADSNNIGVIIGIILAMAVVLGAAFIILRKRG